MPEQRKKRYEVCRFDEQFKVVIVNSWDSYQFAKGEADKLFRETGTSHWVHDIETAGHSATESRAAAKQ